MALPIFGQITYKTVEGSITFPLNATTKFRSSPEKDATGRTVKWTTCTLTVECFISAGDVLGANNQTVDYDFNFMRKVLESPGGVLSVNNKGIGSLLFNNNSSGVCDVDWGPFPKVVEWSALGNVSCYVVWELEFRYLNSFFANTLGVVEFAWGARFDLDADGGTVRTVTGSLSVVGRRESAGSPFKASKYSNADDYRSLVNVDCPIGFVRDRQSFEVNQAKTQLQFTIIDRQLPHEAYPVGITDMNCDWDLDTTTDKGIFTRFIFSFTGSAKAALNYPKSLALKALRDEHDFRFIQLLKQLRTQQGSIIPLPARFRVRETTKGQDARRVHLSIAWILTVLPANAGNYFPRDILQRVGFFKQRANDAQQWRNAMGSGNGPLTQWGHAGVGVDSRDDLVFDLRYDGKISSIGNDRRLNVPSFGEAADTLPFVPINGSYHEYRNDLEAHTITGEVVPVQIDPSNEVSVKIRVDAERCKFKMVGHAVRYGIKPIVPELVRVNGSKVVAFGIPVIKHYDVKNLNGVAIFGTRWERWYQVVDNKASQPQQAAIENPANPEGNGGTSRPNIDVPPNVVGND